MEHNSLQSVRILQPPPPKAYWHVTTLQNAPGFDDEAAAHSAGAVTTYLNRLELEQKDHAPYPPRLITNPMTTLPALLNGYLPGDVSPVAADHFVALAEHWLRDPLVSLAAFGLSPDELFEKPPAGDRPRLERFDLLRSSLPQGDQPYPYDLPSKERAGHTEAQHLGFQQWHDGRWPVYGGRVVLHGGLNDSRVSLSSSFVPLRRDVGFNPRLNLVVAYEVALAAFQAAIAGFDAKAWQVVLAPYAGSRAFILPFGERFHLACRLEAHSPGGEDAWRVFVDVEDAAGVLLGPPERLVSQADAFYLATAVAASASPPVLTTDPALPLAALQAKLALYLTEMTDAVTGLPVALANLPAPLVPAVDAALEAANIAYHAWRILTHFTAACGADGARLLGYDYQYLLLEGFGLDFMATPVNSHQAPPLRFRVGHQAAGVLDMGFNPTSGANPKQITFQSLDQPLDLPGPRRVYNPSLDPEVIQHELAHAIMWLLNPAPFDEPNATVPFTRALLEGYASYFARSLSARHPGDAAANPDGLWGGAAYREAEGWADTWSFVRTSAQVGADVLAAPNAYPGVAISGLPMYELGMVWARALWDMRDLLRTALGAAGLDWADTLALDGFYRCHGLIASFQVAAEGVLDSATQKGISPALVHQIRAKFVTRRICTP